MKKLENVQKINICKIVLFQLLKHGPVDVSQKFTQTTGETYS